MAGTPKAGDIPHLPGCRVLLVAAPYHAAIVAMLEAGARRVLDAAGVEVERAEVPGALEIPAAVALAHRLGRFDAHVALGCVVRGETFHFEIVAMESARGLVDLAVREGVIVGNGILTVDSLEQARVRADPAGEDRGGHAALAALRLLALRRSWEAGR